MPTLLSENNESIFDLDCDIKNLDKGDMAIIGSEKNIIDTINWLCTNGLSGIYFGPHGSTYQYGIFEVSHEAIATGMSIRLYN